MKVVLLAGGRGTRISEESEYLPKPMIEIGGMPILWHIMKEYSHYGFHDFIICGGYKQHIIKKWFADYCFYTSDIEFDFLHGNQMNVYNRKAEPWKVVVADTGLNTMTGGRIKRVQKYIGEETFMMTYADGVCDADLKSLLEFHRSHGRTATLTSVIQKQAKGTLDISYDHSVKSFREKRTKDAVAINAGYMVLEPEIFDNIKDDKTIFETDVLEKLAREGMLMSYQHNGFWQCMDTLLEKNTLEELWESGNAAWKQWNE